MAGPKQDSCRPTISQSLGRSRDTLLRKLRGDENVIRFSDNFERDRRRLGRARSGRGRLSRLTQARRTAPTLVARRRP